MITDRTDIGTGDTFLVTGSIGPDFQPRLFWSKKAAMTYAKHINKTPNTTPFQPVIERRHRSDMDMDCFLTYEEMQVCTVTR